MESGGLIAVEEVWTASQKRGQMWILVMTPIPFHTVKNTMKILRTKISVPLLKII